MSIVVTGATGHLGRFVIEGLLEKVPADRITAVVRSEEKAAGFAARGVKLAIADYNAPETFDGVFSAGTRSSSTPRRPPASRSSRTPAPPAACPPRWPTTTAAPRRRSWRPE
jgi:nucleoside-diphosphate-sugar epimerase